jgi:repressor LexA
MPRHGNSDLHLTPKQKEVLDFISTYAERHGYAPSQSEIARHFNFKSLGTVQNYLVRLERQGLLRKSWNARRGMEVVRPEPPQPAARSIHEYASAAVAQAVPLPLVGRVAAGRPIEAIETMDTLEVPASMLKGGENFVLRVTGDSMIDEGIMNGDFVVIRKQANAQNGQTVVALVGNEATIKKYYRRGGRVELHPANPAYQPLIIESLVESVDFRIEGVLVGLIRRVE